MPDLKNRKVYSGIALNNVLMRAVVYDPAESLEIGEDAFIAPVYQGRIIPIPQSLNQEQLQPYNRLQSENRNKTGKAIEFKEFAYQDYLGSVVI